MLRSPALLLAALLAPPSLPAQAPMTAVIQREVAAMGTWLRVEVAAADRATALAASEALVQAVESVEERLSVWRRGSDVSRVNAARPGREVPVAATTITDLRWAFALRDRLGGAFDPTSGPLIKAYDLRDRPRWPNDDVIARAHAAVGPTHFAVGDRVVTRRHPGAALDCDAFGKGVALDRGREAAIAAGAAELVCDFGGQVLNVGAAATPVEVSVADPRDRERTAYSLRLPAGCSAATSGNGERRVTVDGRELGHLIDPRTGRPAPDFGCVTVVAPSAALADAAATALFVLGPERGFEVARRLGLDAVFVVRDRPESTPRLIKTSYP